MPPPPSPGRRVWIEAVTSQWAARAVALDLEAEPSAAVRASVLRQIVSSLRAEIATPAQPHTTEIARLEQLIARARPYRHPEAGVMINDHPLLDVTDHRLRCRIAALRGEAEPAFVHSRTPLAAVVAMAPPLPPLPPPEPVPFTAGPQLSLFEIAA